MQPRIGIIGNGFVGRATRMLAHDPAQLVVYDVSPQLCVPLGCTLVDVAMCDLIFVCVPTPMRSDRSCNTGLVESVVAQVREIRPDAPIVLRSTVPPGTSQRLGCAFMPEFLTEKNWQDDMYRCPLWILGCTASNSPLASTWCDMIQAAHAHGRILCADQYVCGTTTAEMIKYVRNCYLAAKVAFFNEVAAACEAVGVAYEEVRKGAVADPRIGASHTSVPGPDDKRGFGGTCFPKDTNALAAFCRSQDIPCPVLEAVIHRNETIDRPEQEWKASERSFLG